MEIYRDIEKLKELWGELGPISKLFFAISLTLSCLSIASLADSVREFRGFIAQGIYAYWWITEPVRAWLSNLLPINLTRAELDLGILGIATIVSVLRATWRLASNPNSYSAKNHYILYISEVLEYVLSRSFRAIILIFSVCVLVISISYISRYFGLFHFHNFYVFIIAVLIPLFLVISSRMLPETMYISDWKTDRSYPEKPYSELRVPLKLASSYMIVVYILVAVVASVSEGLDLLAF